MYEIDLDKYKDMPPVRGHYKIGDSYCALGKLIASCGLKVPDMVGDWGFQACPDTQKFLEDITSNVKNKNWKMDVACQNDDKVGSLKDNHEKAFRLAVNTAIESGLVTIKNTSNVMA